MRAPCIIAAVMLCAALAHVPEALSQSSDTTLWVITSRGNLFEMHPLTDVPTTDVVTSPYVEFQRTGGLVVSAGMVREAAQYNDVGTGNTYVISNWGEGETHGIPNAAPLGGEMLLHPVPHLHLRDQKEISPGGGTYFPDSIIRVEPMVGSQVTYTNYTDAEHGEYYEFNGTGRAIVWLQSVSHPINNFVINLVCSGCVDTTRAIVGDVQDIGGVPVSDMWGTVNTAPLMPAEALNQPTTWPAQCTVDGVSHDKCGKYIDYPGYDRDSDNPTPSMWPVDPRPDINGNAGETDRFLIDRVMYFPTLDTATCPNATQANTVPERLDDTHFIAVSEGCVMKSFTTQWRNAVVQLVDPMPLRAGINTYEPINGAHPAIVVNLDGGKIMLQAKHVHHNQIDGAYEDDFVVNTDPPLGRPPLVDSNSVIILHDAYAHLGYYTRATLNQIADRIQTYPQKQTTGTFELVSHNHGGGRIGGLLGDTCSGSHQYCITVFNSDDLPAVHNAAGVLYDPRNDAELNRGGDVGNRANVFVASLSPPTPDTVGYHPSKLTLIQSYAVIPVSGHVNVEELYVMAGRGGGTGCDRYVDDTVDPHVWAAPNSAGWLRLKYLENDYGSGNNLINIPILPRYDTICMRTFGNDEFRQFRVDNFFVQGAAVSYGGVRHITAHDSVPGSPAVAIEYDANPSFTIHTLHTDAVLPGSGVRVLDMDIDLSARVMSASVAEGKGNEFSSVFVRDDHCKWPSTERPSRADSNRHRVTVVINVDIQVPAVGGSYHSIGGLSVADSDPLTARMLPSTIGADCMEVADVEFDFDPEYRTLPIEYQANTPVRITITTTATFSDSSRPEYADVVADETIFVETHIQRLSLRVN